MFEYSAKVLELIDGDTMKLQIDMGFHVHIIETIRLARLNTPEVVNWGAAGLDDPAMKFVAERCPVGSSIVVQISRAEKYGRWLAEVLYSPGVTDREKIKQDPRVLNDELLRAGLAKPYSGGKK